MHFDLAQIPAADAYKLLVSTVVPRPIALATTVDGKGRVNAAPFSFFNAVSSVPPVVVLGISPGDAGGDGYKDTERNIRDSGEFVVNLVDEALAERMNICAVDFPGRHRRTRKGRADAAAVGRGAPAAHRAIAGQLRMPAHHRPVARAALDPGSRPGHPYPHPRRPGRPGKIYVSTDKMRLIGRMHGRGWYARTSDLFLMDRMTREEWEAGNDERPAGSSLDRFAAEMRTGSALFRPGSEFSGET